MTSPDLLELSKRIQEARQLLADTASGLVGSEASMSDACDELRAGILDLQKVLDSALSEPPRR